MKGSTTFQLMRENNSFFSGIASLFEFRNLMDLYNTQESEIAADAQAMYADWIQVGRDMQKGLEVYGKKQEK